VRQKVNATDSKKWINRFAAKDSKPLALGWQCIARDDANDASTTTARIVVHGKRIPHRLYAVHVLNAR
jgi:hypothetical protein